MASISLEFTMEMDVEDFVTQSHGHGRSQALTLSAEDSQTISDTDRSLGARSNHECTADYPLPFSDGDGRSDVASDSLQMANVHNVENPRAAGFASMLGSYGMDADYDDSWGESTEDEAMVSPADEGAVAIPNIAGQLLPLGSASTGLPSMPIDCIQEHSDVSIDSERRHFVQTDDFEEALDILEQHKRVVLYGPPGCGKTATGYAILRHFRKQGYTPYIVAHLHEIRKYISEECKSVVLVDGALGEVRVDRKEHSQWSSALCSMSELNRAGKCLLVFTAYPHILRELQVLDAGRDSPLVESITHVRLMQHPLSCDVKEDILRCRLKDVETAPENRDAVVQKIIDNDSSGEVFPWCCQHQERKWKSFFDPDDVKIFGAPAEAHVPLLMRMLRDPEHGQLIAAVLALAMCDLRHSLDTPRAAQPYLHEFGFENFSDYKLEEYADVLKGSILAEKGGGFCSRVIYDAVGLAFGRTFAFPILLKVCDVQFLVQYVHTKGTSTEFSVCVGSPQARKLLIERLFHEVDRGCLPEISQHPSLQCPQFLRDLKYYDGCRRLVQAVDSTHKKPLLYWSAWNESSVLTEWCLEVMEENPINSHAMSHYLMVTAFARAVLRDRKEKTDTLLPRIVRKIKETGVGNKLKKFVKLPLPATNQLIAEGVKTKCSDLLRVSKSPVLHYIGDSSKPIPTNLVRRNLFQNGDKRKLKIDTSLKQWPLLLRLLTDGDIDVQDEEGNTLLHEAVKTGDFDTVTFAVNCGASMLVRNQEGLFPSQIMTLREHQKRVSRLVCSDLLEFENACRSGDESKINTLLCRIAPNDQDKDRKTPLHFASAYGLRNIVDCLVKLRADVHARDSDGRAPLYVACKNGHTDVVSLLLQKGAQANIKDRYMNTPLHAACFFGHKEVADLLIERKADVNARSRGPFTALRLPDRTGHQDQDLDTPEAGETDAPERLIRQVRGLTPLHLACRNGYDDLVELLIENGAGVNTGAYGSLTPLHAASIYGHVDCVEVLFKHGADINQRLRNGSQALHLACENGHSELAAYLLYKEADVNSMTDHHETPLTLACQAGHTDLADFLLQHGAATDNALEDGFTVLHVVCENGHGLTAEFLIQKGADVNAVTDEGYTPLHMTCQNGHTHTANFLLTCGAQVNARTRAGVTPLHAACVSGCPAAVSLLLEHGADVNAPTATQTRPLHVAAQTGQTEIALMLLSRGADINAVTKEILTALHVACLNGDAALATVLFEHGANVNAQSADGATPLHTASSSGCPQLVGLLVANGAEIDWHDSKGTSPFHLACRQACTAVVEAYLRYGAEVNMRCPVDGFTPLHEACESGQLATARLLILNDANTDAEDSDGCTPLHLACEKGYDEVADFLIANGANVNHPCETGMTPLHQACEHGQKSVAEVLLCKDANVNAKTNTELSPLHIACKNGHTEIVVLLIQRSADVNAVCARGFTPLHKACEEGHTETASKLMEHSDSISVRSFNGATAYDLARWGNHGELADLLRERMPCDTLPSSSVPRRTPRNNRDSIEVPERGRLRFTSLGVGQRLNRFPADYEEESLHRPSLGTLPYYQLPDQSQRYTVQSTSSYSTVHFSHRREYPRKSIKSGKKKSISADRGFKPQAHGRERRHRQCEYREMQNSFDLLKEVCIVFALLFSFGFMALLLFI